jgi:hypothetical protein
MMRRGGPSGIQVSSDYSEAEVGNACMARIVHKDVCLCEHQCGGKSRFWITTYSLEVAVDHIGVVEVLEAPSDIR